MTRLATQRMGNNNSRPRLRGLRVLCLHVCQELHVGSAVLVAIKRSAAAAFRSSLITAAVLGASAPGCCWWPCS